MRSGRAEGAAAEGLSAGCAGVRAEARPGDGLRKSRAVGEGGQCLGQSWCSLGRSRVEVLVRPKRGGVCLGRAWS